MNNFKNQMKLELIPSKSVYINKKINKSNIKLHLADYSIIYIIIVWSINHTIRYKGDRYDHKNYDIAHTHPSN